MKLILELENTAQDLEQAAAVLAALRPLQEAPEIPIVRTTKRIDGGGNPVTGWFTRLGPGSRSFWKRAAIHSKTHREWTFDDLATSDADKKAIRSHHRNSYRAIKAEKASDPLEHHWDYEAGHQVYSMDDSVRDAILALVEVSE
jgi:hypothetical protein